QGDRPRMRLLFFWLMAVSVQAEMITRHYSVVPFRLESQFFEFVTDEDDFGPGRVATSADVRTFFASEGVPFPDGAYLTYLPDRSRLLVHNTPENLKTFEQVFRAIHVEPFQVQIDVSFVSFPEADIVPPARQTGGASVDTQAIRQLWRDGKGRLEAMSRVTTLTGLNALVGSIEENGEVLLGVSHRVTPTVGPDRYTIELTSATEISRATAAGEERCWITTSVVAWDGWTMILGGSRFPDRDRLIYLLITPTILNADGERIRSPRTPFRNVEDVVELNLEPLLGENGMELLGGPPTDDRFIVVAYPVKPSLVSTGESSEDEATGIQGFFQGMGVSFPPGSVMVYNPDTCAILMKNTPFNAEIMDSILSKVGVVANQVEIDAALVGFSQAELEGTDDLKQLWSTGAGSLMAHAKLVTRSGLNTVWTSTLEQAGETNGLVLSVTPIMGFDDRSIELTSQIEWKPAEAEKPRHEFLSSILLENGSSIAVGAVGDWTVKDKAVVLFLTATVIDPSGAVVKKEKRP
ncbi:MAG: hypothetical protein AAF492_12505, partial [Verrucomicrobiota bacterium]